MLVAVVVVVVGLLALGAVFDAVAKRRGTYRDASFFMAASRQRREQRVHLLHALYERRMRRGPPRRDSADPPSADGDHRTL